MFRKTEPLKNRPWNRKHILSLKNYLSNFEKTFLPYFAFILVRLASVILFMRQSEFLEITALLFAIKKSFLPNEIRTEEEIQIHFMFGLPMSDLAEDLILFLSHISDLPSECYCTILQGKRKILEKNPKTTKYDSTIGDDLELVTNELSNSSKVTNKTSSSSIIRNDDDTFVKITSIRKFDTLYTVYSEFKKPWHLHIMLFLLLLLLCVWLNSFIPNAQNSQLSEDLAWLPMCTILLALLFVFIEFVWLSYRLISFILLRLYFSLSIFYIYPSNNSLTKKQILKLFLKLNCLLVILLWYFGFIVIFSTKQFSRDQVNEFILVSTILSVLFCVFSVSLPFVFKLLMIVIKGIYRLILTFIIFSLKLLIRLLTCIQNFLVSVLNDLEWSSSQVLLRLQQIKWMHGLNLQK